MWQEPWGKVELLFVMWVDEPKFLVSYNEPTFVYKTFEQLNACSAFFYAHKFIHSPVLFIAWNRILHEQCYTCILILVSMQ